MTEDKPVRSPKADRQPVGTFAPRVVPAGTKVTYVDQHDPDRPLVTLRAEKFADDYWIIDPRTAAEVAELDARGYPTAAKAIAKRKADAEKAERAAARNAAKDSAAAGADGGSSK
jgi:hypothetical protein